MDYNRAINAVVMRRQSRLDAAAALKDKLIDTDPQFYENERRMRLGQIALARGERVDVDGLMQARERILAAHGLSPADLAPPPECELCNDTGLYEGKPCRCAVKTATEGQSSFNDLELHSLADVQLNLYDEKSKTLIRKVYDNADRFIETFPKNAVRNVVMIGTPGSGKTFLAGCIAGALLKKGFSVVSMTAFGFVNSMLNYHTTFNEQKMAYLSPLLDCDLLVIDDLGTESMLKNVTVEYLYLVLNERMTKNKHTMITTNLSLAQISLRYGERISSRLFDKKSAFVMAFPDEDLRNSHKKK